MQPSAMYTKAIDSTDLAGLPPELADGILSHAVHVAAASAGLDMERYQSSIAAVVNVHFRGILGQTHATALAKMPWIMDLDLLCGKAHPLDVLKWVYSVAMRYHPMLYVHWSYKVVEAASAHGHLDTLEWLSETYGATFVKCWWWTGASGVSASGQLHVLDWWWSCKGRDLLVVRDHRTLFGLDISMLAGAGQVKALDWWLAHGLEVKNHHAKAWMLIAAIGGKQRQFMERMEQLHWSTYDNQALGAAIEAGDLGVFQYVLTQYFRHCSGRDAVGSGDRGLGQQKNWILEKIAKKGSVEVMEWWLQHYPTNSDASVLAGFLAACPKLAMMQLFFDRFPQVILEYGRQRKIPEAFLPSSVPGHNEEDMPVGLDWRVLQWFETKVLSVCGLPKWDWPDLTWIEYIIEACRAGDVKGLRWMLASNSHQFALKCERDSVFGRNYLFHMIGEGGSADVVQWWIDRRFLMHPRDLVHIMKGAVMGGQLDLLEWIRLESKFPFNQTIAALGSERLFVLDRSLATGQCHTLQWLLDHVDNKLFLTSTCFTDFPFLNDAQQIVSNRTTFSAFLFYNHFVLSSKVVAEPLDPYSLVFDEKGWLLPALARCGHWSRDDMSKQEFMEKTLNVAMWEGIYSVLDWWLQDARWDKSHFEFVWNMASQRSADDLLPFLSSKRLLRQRHLIGR